MLINEGGEEHPRALYVVGCKAKKSVWQTHDFKEFQRMVRAIPKGAKVRGYDSCTVNLCYGLPDSVKQGFFKVVSRFGRTEDICHIVCICDSMG